MTDQCVNAFLQDTYTKNTQQHVRWLGKYRARQGNNTVPMILLKKEVNTVGTALNPEKYWRDVLREGGVYIGLWRNYVFYSRNAEDAMLFGLADARTPVSEVMEVYQINPVFNELCLGSAPDARYIHWKNPYANELPAYEGVASPNVEHFATTEGELAKFTWTGENTCANILNQAQQYFSKQDVDGKEIRALQGNTEYRIRKVSEEATNGETNHFIQMFIKQEGEWVKHPSESLCKVAIRNEGQLEDGINQHWGVASTDLNTSTNKRLGELQRLQENVANLRTLQTERGEEVRQELQESQEVINAKNRYLDLIREENHDWDLLIHALITFFFVAAVAMIPLVGWMSQKISDRAFYISMGVLAVVYLGYLAYQVRKTGVKDFTDPQLARSQKFFKNLDSYMRDQAAMAEQALGEFVNQNCLCPPGEEPVPIDQRTGLPMDTDTISKTVHYPQGLIYQDGTAPNQYIDPPAQVNPEDTEYFMIEWQSYWNNSRVNPSSFTHTQIRDVMNQVGMDVNYAKDQSGEQALRDITKAVLMCDTVQNGTSNPFAMPLTLYVKMVLEFIYRGRRPVTIEEVSRYVSKFKDGTYTMNASGSAAMIRDIMNTPAFKLTFGSPFQWFVYICHHPFAVSLDGSSTLTQDL
jgi:hypothetical protein